MNERGGLVKRGAVLWSVCGGRGGAGSTGQGEPCCSGDRTSGHGRSADSLLCPIQVATGADISRNEVGETGSFFFSCGS